MPLPELVTEVDFVGLPTSTYYDTMINTVGSKSYWRMGSNTALTDALGLNTGTFPNAPSTTTGALPNDTDLALSFDGVNDYGTVPSSGSLLEAGSYTLSGWVKFSSLPGAVKTLWTKGAFKLETTAANKLTFSVQNHVAGVSTITSVTTNSTLEAGTYVYVTCVHDATLKQLRIYTDGVLETTASHLVGTELWANPLLFAAKHSGTIPAFGTVGATLKATTADPWVVGAPASIAVGDLLLAQINTVNTAAITPPSGWTQLQTTTYTSTRSVFLFYKIAVAGDVGAANYTFDFATTTSGHAVISRFTGVDTTQPFANPPYETILTGTGTSFSTGAKLPQTDDILLLGIWSSSRDRTFAPGTGTERYDTSTGGAAADFAMALYTTTVAAAASTSMDVTMGVSDSNQALSGIWLALKGPDAQDFTAVQLDEWTFHSAAFDDEAVFGNFQARLAGVSVWTELATNGIKDTRNVSLRYGRQYELNRMEAGSATAVVKNQARKYDPANTSSVYYPNVKANRKIRFRALLSSVYYTLFEGFVERWPSNWDVPNYDELTLTIADGFKPLNRAGVSGTLESGLSGTQIATVLNRALWPSDRRALDTGLFVMAADESTTTTQALGVIQDIGDSELGIVFINHTTTGSPLTFHDRAHRWSNTRSLNSQATFSDQMNFVSYQDLKPSFDDDNMVNEWNVTTATGFSGTAVDVVSRSENYPVTQTRSTRLDAPADAGVQATSLLQQTSKPALRFDALVLKLAASTPVLVWQKALTLAISDRVTVIRNPVPSAGGSTITRDCFIEGISWSITPDQWQVSYQLSPVATQSYCNTVTLDQPVSYWRFNTSS
jgi:hypothetical protein